MPGLSGPPGAIAAAPATPPTTAPTGPPTTAPATTPVAVPADCCGVWQAVMDRPMSAARRSFRIVTPPREPSRGSLTCQRVGEFASDRGPSAEKGLSGLNRPSSIPCYRPCFAAGSKHQPIIYRVERTVPRTVSRDMTHHDNLQPAPSGPRGRHLEEHYPSRNPIRAAVGDADRRRRVLDRPRRTVQGLPAKERCERS